MRLPALRPSLQCIMAPTDNINNTANAYHSGYVQNFVDGVFVQDDVGSGVFSTQNAEFPWYLLDVSNTTVAEQLGSAIWTNTFIIPNDTETSVPLTQVGLASSVQWKEDGNTSALVQTVYDQTGGLDIDSSAANFGFAAGGLSGTKTNQMMNMSLSGANNILADRWDLKIDLVVALCYQILEEVQTDITFN